MSAWAVDKRRSLLALDWLNFFMADVETGIGPFVSTYLSSGRHWDPAQIGLVLGAQSLAGILAQTPAGWIIDHVPAKKWILTFVAIVISIGAFCIVAVPDVSGQVANQVAIGIAAAFVSPCIASMSLGLVGRDAFAPRVGRNAAWSHGGNVTTALFAGYLGYAFGQEKIFLACSGLGAAVLASIFFIRNRDIDNRAARALPEGNAEGAGPQTLAEIFRNTSLLAFLAIVVLFHMASAPMLPLAGQELARAVRGSSSLYMSACIVTAQFVMVPVSFGVGKLSDRTGRKPIFLLGFAVLGARGLLFALGRGPVYIVAVEALDGMGTAIAGVTSLLVVSDLARGTGRFNLMQGMMQAAVGAGAFLGNTGAGRIAKTAGFPFAFSVLASVALAGAAFYSLRMPETVRAKAG